VGHADDAAASGQLERHPERPASESASRGLTLYPPRARSPALPSRQAPPRDAGRLRALAAARRRRRGCGRSSPGSPPWARPCGGPRGPGPTPAPGTAAAAAHASARPAPTGKPGRPSPSPRSGTTARRACGGSGLPLPQPSPDAALAIAEVPPYLGLHGKHLPARGEGCLMRCTKRQPRGDGPRGRQTAARTFSPLSRGGRGPDAIPPGRWTSAPTRRFWKKVKPCGFVLRGLSIGGLR
jgi:hypothetical protein